MIFLEELEQTAAAATDEYFVHDKEFCKMFVLKSGWPLPDANAMYTEPEWKLNEFQELKAALNRTKQKLNDFDLDAWHVHTGKLNPAGQVVNHVRRHVRPDFLTQAWCKFYEIAWSSDLVSLDEIHGEGGTSFTSVHLCEAPGAFIAALNHFLAINYEQLRLDWLAMTLNPHHESNGHPDIVTDDRLMLHTLPNWEFGPDYTGDIFQPGYAEHLYRTVLDRFGGKGAWLVTADGSIDCSDDPGEQETVVSRLHDHETMVALNVLRDGGSLVLKAFTVFECNTICRMFLLCCLFRSVVLRKPATSKPGNSEVYVVCKGYRGRSEAMPYVRAYYAYDRHRRPSLGGGACSMFPLSLVPVEFRQRLFECAEYFARLQMRTIDDNVVALPVRETLYCKMKPVQASLCREFVVRLGLRPIRYKRELTSVSPNNFGHKTNWRDRARIGRKPPRGLSYSEKTRIRNMDAAQEAAALYREVGQCHEWSASQQRQMDDDVVWHRRVHLAYRLPDVAFRLGKPVTAVKGSKFCCEAMIYYRQRVLSRFPRVRGGGGAVDAGCRQSHYRAKIDRPRAAVCDLTEVIDEHASDNTALQHRCLVAIVDALRSLSDGDDLVIVGYPLYTQLSVANVYAVAKMFDTYGLVKPDRVYGHALVFLKFSSAHHGGWLAVLAKAVGCLVPGDNGGMALVSWMPVKVLLEQKVYADIVTVNNLCILHEVEPILLSASSAAPSS
ncbi:cap-specific mRNA (nucleoside-2'-O-)-methyltransferase 2-like [Melanaphis sacchari]|uniref:cap-specific mRNA (nucleoside-2'-O-)-methyltransferase 2-like n=1 Tax=Melanaphis sacchari TaxID=742174 RepID=UPI000DC13ADF|nr:cap-specific mRNA (nucleoside-2'-O-)-methyltransferase 2-like [Melanaphis sacchari]